MCFRRQVKKMSSSYIVTKPILNIFILISRIIWKISESSMRITKNKVRLLYTHREWIFR